MKRRSELDFLRAIAVFLIILLHSKASVVMVRMGWIGVDLFFVLSGFLVSGLLFKEYKGTGKVRPYHFLARRGFKIYPLFYIVLFAHVGYYVYKRLYFNSSQVLAEMLFFQNYRPGLMGVSWSLAIEEHFYILLVATVFFAAKKDKINNSFVIPVCCILVCVTCFFLRTFFFMSRGYQSVFVNDFPTHLRMDSLAFGVLLAYSYHFQNESFARFFKLNRSILFPISLLLLTPFFIWERQSFFICTIGYTMLYLSFGIILSLAILYSDDIAKMFKIIKLDSLYNSIAFVGRYSYGIYLCHFIVGSASISWIKTNVSHNLPASVYVFFYVGISVFVGILVSKLIEQPFLQMREKLFPKTI